ncbi:hypothetical protein OHA72_46875 [Dactylosporangium sp. NBC_01737]|uniref:hypothetical protein n=1 Tax=Dactylosporangium sp. NBC_01737 TaxID=2975959 RepID=UPI002E0E81CD|nr:hypothetical protein OHA72_46875 [Dactylosporangium sp. NBC_01737]
MPVVTGEHGGDEPDGRLTRTTGDSDRAERRNRQHRDRMGGAGVRDNRPPGRLQWQIGQAHRELPTLVQHAATGGVDQLGQLGGAVDEPVDEDANGPSDARRTGGEHVRKLVDDLAGQVRGRSGRRDQPDDHRVSLATSRRALTYRAY